MLIARRTPLGSKPASFKRIWRVISPTGKANPVLQTLRQLRANSFTNHSLFSSAERDESLSTHPNRFSEPTPVTPTQRWWLAQSFFEPTPFSLYASYS